MKLSHWAKKQGIHYSTAYRWFRQGLIPNSRKLSTGTILVDDIPEARLDDKGPVDIYCRVSSHNKKDDLERQAQRCIDFCSANGLSVRKVTKEIASGMNDRRPKLMKLLEGSPSHIVVEHKDRLTRFGFNYFEKLLPKTGCRVTVINRDHEDESDLIKDLVAIVTSYCCRLYGIRRGQNKSNKIRELLS